MTDCTKYNLCTALGQSCEGCVNYDPVTVVELVRPVQVVTKCLPGFGVFKKWHKPKNPQCYWKAEMIAYVQNNLAKKYWYVEI